MKKILVLALFLVVVVSTVAAISASEDLTLEGIKFNIPDGYSLIEQETDATEGADTEHMDGTAVDKEVTSEYKNSAGDKLNVHVGVKNNQKIVGYSRIFNPSHFFVVKSVTFNIFSL